MMTPATIPKLAKALGMLREPRAIASTMRQIWIGQVGSAILFTAATTNVVAM